MPSKEINAKIVAEDGTVLDERKIKVREFDGTEEIAPGVLRAVDGPSGSADRARAFADTKEIKPGVLVAEEIPGGGSDWRELKH